MTKQSEPERLKRGKAFHRKVQEAWRGEGVSAEKRIRKPSGRTGRIDIHVASEGDTGVAEIKATDWDRMNETAIRRNVRRQARQVWAYIESQLEEGHSVSPAMIFPARPRSRTRLRLIESLFEEEFIAVVWEDETIAERRRRAGYTDTEGD